ncbi:MAG: hypothetical protein KA319_06520 [Ferruginibacter sp.]|nr:hypothetical protein [Ferruginibacter sp.]
MRYLCIFIGILVSYTFWLFFYLKAVGVYGIATINAAFPSSDGVRYEYEFSYKNLLYKGDFMGLSGYKIGDCYFVRFSPKYPEKNLLQYDNKVPECLRDSVHLFWEKIPICEDSGIKK